MTAQRIFYKLLIRDGQLRSYTEERIVWYDENTDVQDDYPLFVFDTYDSAWLFYRTQHARLRRDLEIWLVKCEAPRSIQYGRGTHETIEMFWQRMIDGEQPQFYEYDGQLYPRHELPVGTYICDLLRLIERIL